MAFRWRDNLATGVSMVDEQHKELIKRTNSLLEHMKSGKGNDEIIQVLDFLSSYVHEHFTDEEKVMTDYNYPDYASHKQQHTEFINTVNKLKQKMTPDKILSTFVLEVNREICDWLIDHILKQDKEMAQFIQNQRKNEISMNI